MRIEYEFRVCIHECRAFDTGIEFAPAYCNSSFKHAAHNAFLFPDLPLTKLPVRIQTSQLGAGAGAARRAIVGVARAEHKILAVYPRFVRRGKEFDVINFLAIVARDSSVAKSLADGPGDVRQLVNLTQFQFHLVILYQEEPVSSPGHITSHLAMAGHTYCDASSAAIARNIVDGHFTTFMQDCADHAYTRLNAMLAGKNTSEIFEADHQANRSMAAHAKVSNIIEEDDTGGAGRVYRFTQQSSDDHIGAARLIYDCRSEGVVLGAKAFLPFREREALIAGIKRELESIS